MTLADDTFILHGDFHEMHEERKGGRGGRISNEVKELKLTQINHTNRQTIDSFELPEAETLIRMMLN